MTLHGFEHLHVDYNFDAMDAFQAHRAEQLYQESMNALKDVIDFMKLPPDFLKELTKEKKHRSIDDPWEDSSCSAKTSI